MRVLALMAMADGVVADEEKEMLDRIGKQFLKHSELADWEHVFRDPMNLKAVSRNVAISDRPLTAKLAYMVISACREDYGFAVNSAERRAFDELTEALELTEVQKDQAIEEATREISQKTGFWNILINTFSNQFRLDTDPNPISSSN